MNPFTRKKDFYGNQKTSLFKGNQSNQNCLKKSMFSNMDKMKDHTLKSNPDGRITADLLKLIKDEGP